MPVNNDIFWSDTLAVPETTRKVSKIYGTKTSENVKD
jgi:hypothetical protein